VTSGQAKGRTLVLGLGNPVLSDDRVGLEVVREVERRLGSHAGIDVREAYVAGLDLLDLLSGYSQAVLVDAMSTPGGEPGSLVRMASGELRGSERLAAMHEVNVATALTLGRRLGIALPDEITIYGVEVRDAQTFGEKMSPPVCEAVAAAAAQIVHEVAGHDIANGRFGSQEVRHDREDKSSGCR
jgi:hydrogenase maturation protease